MPESAEADDRSWALPAAGLTLLGLSINTFPEVHVPPRFHGTNGSAN